MPWQEAHIHKNIPFNKKNLYLDLLSPAVHTYLPTYLPTYIPTYIPTLRFKDAYYIIESETVAFMTCFFRCSYTIHSWPS